MDGIRMDLGEIGWEEIGWEEVWNGFMTHDVLKAF
jgi:hypothetical protein